ncbi:MAG: RES domain-containing protein [Nitrospirae bacterium]|jgi:RES domain-containing protein|nr:RES domain-containing protein [Nitrospirota bacterium]
MRVWRIIPKLHLSQAFDGEGARQFGGRWNRIGTRVVYTSATLSLAALEFFVNLDRDTEPDQLVAISADIPDDLRIGHIEVSDLPKNWRSYPVPEELQDFGTAWVASASTAMLVVPSAVIPDERNYLLNPAHPDFKRLRLNRPEAFHFDPRMWK